MITPKYIHTHILAKGDPERTCLMQHLHETATLATSFARYYKLDVMTAYILACFHDIGKASPIFQRRLFVFLYDPPYRHEIGSIFFISLLPEEYRDKVLEAVIAHHKSIHISTAESNAGYVGRGFLDLEYYYFSNDGENFKNHIEDFDNWKNIVIDILVALNVPLVKTEITKEEAERNYYECIAKVRNYKNERGCSEWRGLLNTSDHLSSALIENSSNHIPYINSIPDLSFYSKIAPTSLYPFSMIDGKDSRPHTLAIAPTGGGKTALLFKRCNGRVVYGLPFQASINAMYNRIKKDISIYNPFSNISVQHASSKVVVEKGNVYEKSIQGKAGSSVKVTTPQQLIPILFGTTGYESIILDLKGCDVILDEIHVYSGKMQRILFKLIEVLKFLECRIHIGTATMSTALYNQVINALGHENVYEVRLTEIQLDSFNRHIVKKMNQQHLPLDLIKERIALGEKILLVANTVKQSQEWYNQIEGIFPGVNKMLVHSRFKRFDRNNLEKRLVSNEFNEGVGPCIVVSTQVIEVSLDISFDFMVTQLAPIDSLIQRFGRINRKRTLDTIGKYKTIVVLGVPHPKKSAPYEIDVLQRTWDCLKTDVILEEKNMQNLLDYVFPTVPEFGQDEAWCIFKNGKFDQTKCFNYSKSKLISELEIESAIGVLKSDLETYQKSNKNEQIQYEIPLSIGTAKKLQQDVLGNKPFIVPDQFYSPILGLKL